MHRSTVMDGNGKSGESSTDVAAERLRLRDLAIFTANIRKLGSFWKRVQVRTRVLSGFLLAWQISGFITLSRALISTGGSVIHLHWSQYLLWLSNILVVAVLFFRTDFLGNFFCADRHEMQMRHCLQKSLNLQLRRGRLKRFSRTGGISKAAGTHAAYFQKVAKDHHNNSSSRKKLK